MKEPTLCLSVATCKTNHEKGGEYQCPKFATALDSPCADVGCGSLKKPAIACLTLGLSRGMNGVNERE